MTSLERGKVALKFIDMNENPERYMMNNRFLEREMAKPSHGAGQRSPFEANKDKLVDLLK